MTFSVKTRAIGFFVSQNHPYIGRAYVLLTYPAPSGSMLGLLG